MSKDKKEEVSCGNETAIGMFESWQPTAYEWCRDQRTPLRHLLKG